MWRSSARSPRRRHPALPHPACLSWRHEFSFRAAFHAFFVGGRPRGERAGSAASFVRPPDNSCLSSDLQAVTRRGFHALAVYVDDAAVDACFEVFGIFEGPVGEVMSLQIAPGEFDVVQLGSVFRQPLDREPGTRSASAARLAGWCGSDRCRGREPPAALPCQAAARSGGRSSRGEPRSRCCSAPGL